MPQQTRVGARAPGLVPAEIRIRLEHGEPSANHMEQIAMDMGALLETAFPSLEGEADRLRSGGLVTKMRTGGQVLYEALGEAAWTAAGASSSDSVRGWGAMAIGWAPDLDFDGRLRLMRPYADDPHFAVREWAWLSLRPYVVTAPVPAIEALVPWTVEESQYLRRFASEVTRPRGVWSAHVAALKAEPALGLAVLEPLHADSSRYVQDSVANWLNDASKSRPDWVEELCRKWLAGSEAEATGRICHRAQRSIRAAKARVPESSAPALQAELSTSAISPRRDPQVGTSSPA